MTAVDVIDQIKALPPPELAKVVTFVHGLEAATPQVRYMSDEKFNEVVERVFDEHAELMQKLSE